MVTRATVLECTPQLPHTVFGIVHSLWFESKLDDSTVSGVWQNLKLCVIIRAAERCRHAGPKYVSSIMHNGVEGERPSEARGSEGTNEIIANGGANEPAPLLKPSLANCPRRWGSYCSVRSSLCHHTR